ncbi:hypothetical protein GCM10010988_06220 [Cnuibacter physcomitrellae]|uniref:Uncharacterized protein n=1 Tax=Cnuibacter physcomitrellae TaxID=1619308 RepID=A0A1X9LMM1_9MICO|nr:hypothetical protein [Cnuibacter physcomitrellae]ARJ05528.1 hypothetical protein B5808_10050 [Cnuibacter physcomitrellae]GGI35892.1 hypothetical protein GCM10010988_06220 [Cnuibacter physcomitrellae]
MTHAYTRVIHYGGRVYLATETMSDIFSAHAHDTIERGDTELVPLLHEGGVEMLLITPATRFAVTEIEVGLKSPPVIAPATPLEQDRRVAG